MEELPYDEDPEPLDRSPAGPLYVPVRPARPGVRGAALPHPLGDRTAVGFTSERGLLATLGPAQAWTRLAEPALRALIAPLGVATVTVDPVLTAPAPAPITTGAPEDPASATIPALRIVWGGRHDDHSARTRYHGRPRRTVGRHMVALETLKVK